VQLSKLQSFSMLKQLLKRHWTAVRAKSLTSRVDAFLVSYPKSGRTWLRYILANYLVAANKLDITIDTQTFFAVVPNFDSDPVRGIPKFLARNWPASVPLIAVSHASFQAAVFRNKKAIMLVRNPHDVVVSAYFHETRHKHRFAGSIGDFIEDREHGLPALVQYLNSWAKDLQSIEHCVVTYEKLSAEPGKEIARLLAFLSIPINPEALRAAITASQFDEMQRAEISVGIPGHDYDRTDSESRRMRKGKALGYRDYLNHKQIDRVDQILEQALSTQAKVFLKNTAEPLVP
jgi:hypothetical protein